MRVKSLRKKLKGEGEAVKIAKSMGDMLTTSDTSESEAGSEDTTQNTTDWFANPEEYLSEPDTQQEDLDNRKNAERVQTLKMHISPKGKPSVCRLKE